MSPTKQAKRQTQNFKLRHDRHRQLELAVGHAHYHKIGRILMMIQIKITATTTAHSNANDPTGSRIIIPTTH